MLVLTDAQPLWPPLPIARSLRSRWRAVAGLSSELPLAFFWLSSVFQSTVSNYSVLPPDAQPTARCLEIQPTRMYGTLRFMRRAANTAVSLSIALELNRVSLCLLCIFSVMR